MVADLIEFCVAVEAEFLWGRGVKEATDVARRAIPARAVMAYFMITCDAYIW